MSRQQKTLYPKASPDYSNNAGLFQFSNSRLPRPYHVQDKPSQQIFRTKRKHVLKACERCRVKKSKCDGNQPCGRCLTYNQSCIFRDRKATQEKVYSRGFVEMLISQHAVHLQALQDLYRRCVSREGLPGSPLEDPVHGRPGTHAILDRLGLIKHAEEMTEDPKAVLADLIEYLQSLEPASDSSLDSAESTEPSEATQSGDPSPEPGTPPREELPDASEPSIADKWSGSAENYYPYQGIDSHKPASQHHNHHHHQQHPHHYHHEQQHSALSMASFPYQDNAGHSHLLEPSSIQQQRYGQIDLCCQENELASESMWSLPYHHSMPGLLPYGNREHLMGIDQDSYTGMSQYGGHDFYSAFLQR